MTEFSARIIGINRVVSQDRGDWTSMTLKARVFQPIMNKTATRVYFFFNITSDAGFTMVWG